MVSEDWEHRNTNKVRRGVWIGFLAAMGYSKGRQIRTGGPNPAGLRRSRGEEIGGGKVAVAR